MERADLISISSRTSNTMTTKGIRPISRRCWIPLKTRAPKVYNASRGLSPSICIVLKGLTSILVRASVKYSRNNCVTLHITFMRKYGVLAHSLWLLTFQCLELNPINTQCAGHPYCPSPDYVTHLLHAYAHCPDVQLYITEIVEVPPSWTPTHTASTKASL